MNPGPGRVSSTVGVLDPWPREGSSLILGQQGAHVRLGLTYADIGYDKWNTCSFSALNGASATEGSTPFWSRL
jgi:hypothetical protein